MIADSIIRPHGVGRTIQGFFNRTTLSDARYVLVQNIKESGFSGGSLIIVPRTCFIFITTLAEGNNFTNTKKISIKGDSDSFIIQKKANEVLFAQNSSTPLAGGNADDNPNGILFTKISNPWEEGREDDNEF